QGLVPFRNTVIHRTVLHALHLRLLLHAEVEDLLHLLGLKPAEDLPPACRQVIHGYAVHFDEISAVAVHLQLQRIAHQAGIAPPACQDDLHSLVLAPDLRLLRAFTDLARLVQQGSVHIQNDPPNHLPAPLSSPIWYQISFTARPSLFARFPQFFATSTHA